jgi:predicted TIM-barrel fold metal-dependent hydrolase
MERRDIFGMVSGEPDPRALLFTHPQVHVDSARIVHTEPRPAFRRVLLGIVEAGHGDRVLFGSDRMIWPGVIEPAIQAIEEAGTSIPWPTERSRAASRPAACRAEGRGRSAP